MQNPDELLTLVLPLKGRTDFSLRIMEYLDQTRFPFKLIIADGGDDDGVGKILSGAENFPNVDFRYLRYPFDKAYSDYYRKMVSALSEVRTPYVSLIDNDCFPVLEGLTESVEFLQSNPGYSTCRGQHIDFVLAPFPGAEGDLLRGSSLAIDPDYFDRAHTIWNSFVSDDPLERIMEWSHCMNIMHYNVYRTDVLAGAWKFILANDCCDLFFCEIALALNALASGKTKVLDVPFIMRQQNSPESVSRIAIRNMDILDRMFVEKWTKDINQLINEIADMASRSGNKPKSEAVSKTRLALKNHYADRLYSYLQKRNMAKAEAGDASPGSSRQIIVSRPEDVESSLRGIVEFLMHKSLG